MPAEKKKVLVIDDSALVRQTLKDILESDPALEVTTAADPYQAAEKIKKEIPDVITLDVEMPRMDGLTFLKKLMAQLPVPVVVISSLTGNNSETALKALDLGAVDVYTKPQWGNTKQALEEQRIRLVDMVKSAAYAKTRRRQHAPDTPFSGQPAARGHAPKKLSMLKTTEKVIAIGASTGGTEAIKDILVALPPDCPGIVIVQHMPEFFTRSFAQRLDSLCQITVKEAEDGDSVLRGRALIAPGNKHMLLKRSGARYYVEIKTGPLVNRHRPSVDVLFKSVAQFAGSNSVGFLLTGMGADGALGLLDMKNAGSRTYAQDEDSSVVFGMPKEAVKLGATSTMLPLGKIAGFIVSA